MFHRICYSSPTLKSLIIKAGSMNKSERVDALGLINIDDLQDLDYIYEQTSDEFLDQFLTIYHDSFVFKDKNQLFAKVLRNYFNTQLDFKVLGLKTPTTVLDQIVDHESNHPIWSVHDLLQHRFTGNKFIFGAFHPLLGNRLLGYLKIALDNKVASNVNDLLMNSSNEFDIANFYSIISPHSYLSGLGIGKLLISKAVSYLQYKHNTSGFYTLSPIPNFVKWTISQHKTIGHDTLLPLALEYLMTSKKGFLCHCPVQNFHLQNGASLYRINNKANVSRLGLQTSMGVMVNYEYDLATMAINSSNYIKEGRIVNKCL